MGKIVDRADINFDNGLPRGTGKDTHRMLGKRGNFRKNRRAETSGKQFSYRGVISGRLFHGL